MTLFRQILAPIERLAWDPTCSGRRFRSASVTVRTVLVLGLVTTALGIGPTDADAAGPLCFSTPPFLDVFVWFVSPTGGNQFAGSGRDLAGDRTQTVSGFVSGNIATVGFVTHPGLSDTVAVTGSGRIDLTTGTGPGSCFGPDFESCGSFTFTAITCPSGATAAAAADPRLPTGRVQGIVGVGR